MSIDFHTKAMNYHKKQAAKCMDEAKVHETAKNFRQAKKLEKEGFMHEDLASRHYNKLRKLGVSMGVQQALAALSPDFKVESDLDFKGMRKKEGKKKAANYVANEHGKMIKYHSKKLNTHAKKNDPTSQSKASFHKEELTRHKVAYGKVAGRPFGV